MIVVKLLQVLTLLAALAGTIGVLIINSRLDRLTEQIQTRQDLPLSGAAEHHERDPPGR